MCCCVLSTVAAHFITSGKLKVGSHEMLITKFTGNIHEFPEVNKEQLSEHVIDRSSRLNEPRHEGTCVTSPRVK